MTEDLSAFVRSQLEIQRKLESAKALEGFDLSQLRSWSDLDLAAWQVQYGPGSMQSILAAQEWQRRITARQIRASHITAWVGVIGTLSGALGGALLGWWLSSLQQRQQPQVQAQSHAAGQPAIQQPVATPPDKQAPSTPTPVQQPLNPKP